MKKPEPISTSNTALAAYLMCNEHDFQGFIRDKHDSQRRIFVFIKQDTSEELVKEFEFGDPQVNARKYQAKLKQAHKLLSEEKDRA